MKQIIKTSLAPQPIGPYSQAILINGFLYVSGQIAIDPSTATLLNTDIETETKRILANIKAIIEKAGFAMNDIVKTSIFLTDINNFKKVNEIYGSYFDGNYPAREVVEVNRLPMNANIMISVIVTEPN